MFLKEIEIQGFKSFADRTKVVFDRGVTAVVGPNGSGKSNITESLRWALGESSVKSLRGGKMPDVIFAGTETRKPLNFASVQVVLDNQDRFIPDAGDEIRIERQVYRNGDSDYKIDGRKVRLKDIHHLFMDTGLGRDSFSVISQGRVEEIFNSKPEDRRAIFEEAAGVLKYKTRRKETEGKLRETQDNLDRLEDIIYELDSQIRPLEKQAERARDFLTLDEERKSLYLDVLIASILLDKEKYGQLEEDLTSLQGELRDYYRKREGLEVEGSQLKSRRQSLQKEMEEDRTNLLSLTSLVSDLKHKIEVAKLESQQASQTKKEQEERLRLLTAKEEEVLGLLEEKTATLASLQEDLTQNRIQAQSLEGELAAFSGNPEQVMDQLREKFLALMQEEADVSNHLTALEGQIENDLKLSVTKQKEFSQLESQLTEVREQAQGQEQVFDQAKAAVAALLFSYQQEKQVMDQLETRYQKEQGDMFALMDQLKSQQARYQSLDSIWKNHSNFYAGVKAVLQEGERLGGILGAVSEHLSFDSRYQTALEIALGASSQHIIVADEQAATRAIDFLRKNRSGRATFLPLTTIKPRELGDFQRQTLESSTGFLGLASDLVTYPAQMAGIFRNLLGVTAIFADVQTAKEAAQKLRYQVRIVTLDGTELRTGGAYSGGANRNQNTIFIKPEMEGLAKEIATKESLLKSKEKEVANLQLELTESRQKLDDIKGQGEEARLKEAQAQLAHDQLTKQLEDLSRLYDLQKEALHVLGQEGLESQKIQLESRLKDIQTQKEALEGEIAEVKSNKDALAGKLEELSSQLSELRLRETELVSQERYERADLKRLEREQEGLLLEKESLQNRLESDSIGSSSEQIAAYQEQLTEAERKEVSCNQALIRRKFELEDVEAQLEDLTSHLEQLRQKNENLIRSQAKTEAEKESLADRLRKLSQDLTEDYRMSFEEARAAAQEVEDLELAKTQVRDLERKIKALGPVNLEAIEQFDEVKERLDFLSCQRDDILSAKNLLLDTIEEMNGEVKERFKATFEAIRESFQLTFRQMFGGGRADLLLTEGDLLTAGVEISVQPPGKKIQSLNLMSGGEKALSALALLFSIIRIKTIPFVILDEVEAALDEANVKRFGDYLNRFDKDSQFIVVTHRKGTMAAADSIYGVTMQESGISKVVSVKLKDLESM